MIERLRRLFDLLDPMPAVAVTPVDIAWDRLEIVPDLGTRGTSLCFAREDLVVHVEIGAKLTGMLIGAGEIEVRWPGGVTRSSVHPSGLFEVDGVPAGPIQLIVGNAVTDWFVR